MTLIGPPAAVRTEQNALMSARVDLGRTLAQAQQALERTKTPVSARVAPGATDGAPVASLARRERPKRKPLPELKTLADCPKNWWTIRPNDGGGYQLRTKVTIMGKKVPTLLDGGAGVNSVSEELVVGVRNQAHKKGLRAGDKEYPVIELQTWKEKETVTGVRKDANIQLVGSVVMLIEFCGINQKEGPKTRIQFKIFKAGQSDFLGVILGGRVLDARERGGLGHVVTPGAHVMESLGVMMERHEADAVSYTHLTLPTKRIV